MQLRIVLVSTMVALSAHAALACGYHSSLDSSTFNVAHPGSLAVATAIYRAQDRGTLDARITTSRSASLFGAGYREAVQYLKQLERSVARSATAWNDTGRQRFALLLVRSRLWTDFTAQLGRAKANIHVDGPVEGEPIVLTDESVLRALFSGQLTLDAAIDQGLVRIVDDHDRKTHALLQAALATTGSLSSSTSAFGGFYQ
ncbi:hypothetical protein [Sinorhizobium meliloti]|uniref:hypothetical protein n=1 Tax=Rhizobium meliloti TaxID=382 RepID=UPI001296799B|nr:hypothetical protein [Sinorhizobium meliloti]MDW9393083.1 hypothetical protein [Sinorhizobium meliloti]MDW9436969.1 hypothetical protein [Sinorhizobium meliloti]MDW9478573.1 hypothetical protein [Sinorhizobium meliloti]MDW9591969.1 hypothetical protein [Sinorhizobium meliloti]MDW9618603.1 hypothetical protein [Sinorhizobium meliloti]